MNAYDIIVHQVALQTPSYGDVTALDRKWQANWEVAKLRWIMWCQHRICGKRAGLAASMPALSALHASGKDLFLVYRVHLRFLKWDAYLERPKKQ
jgi:hypothetical protein